MKNRLPSIIIGLNAVLLLYLVHGLLSSVSPTVGMYWPLLGLLPLIVFGIWAYFLPDPAQARAVRWAAPISGWYELPPTYDSHQERMINITCAAWNAVTGLVVIHFWRHGESPADALTRIVFYGGCAVYVLIGLSLAITALNRWAGGRKLLVKHMHVESSKLPLLIGRPVKLKIEAEFAMGTRPVIVRLGVSCMRQSAQYVLGTPLYIARKYYVEQWSEVMVNQTIASGQRLLLERDFQIPADAPPSSPQDKAQSPWFVWQVAVIVTFADTRQYRRYHIVPAEHAQAKKPARQRSVAATDAT